MFVATSPTTNSTHPSSYIVAATTTATTTTAATTTTSSSVITTANSPPDSTATTAAANNATPQTLSDIQLICIQRKKRSKRHIYLTFVESRPLSSTNEQPCIEVVRKAGSSSSSSASATPPVIYGLNECISFEYFDTVKNDFQAFIHAYFESYTISIFFSEENLEKKTLIIKHLEYMYHSKTEKSTEMNNNSSSDANQSQSNIAPSSAQQQTPILPCPSTTEHILHTFDVSLIPYEPIIHRDHVLVGPARLYFTTTDLYIASIHCDRMDLKVTITNQCPSKDKAILCIPYFTIKNYGNRSNIFLIELGKSNYGNGEIHMKCHSSSLASTIHLLVSPVIEERPLILSSAFQNQLLTHKRMEKSKNIHPPIQLTSDTTTQSILDSPLTVIKKKAMETSTPTESRPAPSASNDLKSRFVVGFFRTLSKNVSHLRRSATFHNNNNNNNLNMTSNGHNVQQSTISENPVKSKYVGFNTDESRFHHDQHHINLPDPEKKDDSISNTSSTLTKQTNETVLTSTLTINTNRTEPTLGTYIDMGPTIPKSNQNPPEEMEHESIMEEPAATAEIGVNTTISLSPNVRSAIIVGNSVHLIADEKTLFPIGQRSFTSPASVMQPFKTQLNGPSPINPYASADLITSSPNSSGSLHQPNSGSNSQKSLLLSYGIVTFNTNELLSTEQLDPTNASIYDGSTLDQRLNSDISLMSTQQQGSAIQSFDNVLSSSSAHIFRTLSVSASNIVDTPTGQIIFIDDHVNDQTATYLLGAPPMVNEETVSNNSTRPSPLNPATSISRAQLSHIDEEKAATHDPYALVEPTPRDHPPSTASSILASSSLPSSSEKSIHYAEVLLPTHSNSNHDQFECNDPQQQQTTIAASATIQLSHSEDGNEENNDMEDLERERKDLAASTKLYTDIDFHQTQRRERIVQLGAKAKLEDQAPPFVL